MLKIDGWNNEAEVNIVENPIGVDYISFGKLRWKQFIDIMRMHGNKMYDSMMTNASG